jgi:hypothetical protein
MRKIIQTSLIGVLIAASVSAYAASSVVDSTTGKKIKKNLKNILPVFVVDKILLTQFSGFN